ncbi:hypothetical protein HYH03_014258 [Edaphochlamys debaryana]|uniref:Uncharacterized protein n=1 Tax=Edaphochlamys debaryana TaxID=47281 RepID=A0A835XUJ0_9CHLO|nr:hypothetical protein HYH03_014258 [Edaphochlamys debaryana]|eukprot:KAG2487145.1 hypothetical protein HYH03_014258 [Edaphochlamys debaryana]
MDERLRAGDEDESDDEEISARDAEAHVSPPTQQPEERAEAKATSKMGTIGKKLANLFARKSLSHDEPAHNSSPKAGRQVAALKVNNMAFQCPASSGSGSAQLLISGSDNPALSVTHRAPSITSALRSGCGAAPLRPSSSRRANPEHARPPTCAPSTLHDSDQHLPEVNRRAGSMTAGTGSMPSPAASNPASASFVRFDLDVGYVAHEPYSPHHAPSSPGAARLPAWPSEAGMGPYAGPAAAGPSWQSSQGGERRQSLRQLLPYEQQAAREAHLQALHQRDPRTRRSSAGPSVLSGAAAAAAASFAAAYAPPDDPGACAADGDWGALPPASPLRRSTSRLLLAAGCQQAAPGSPGGAPSPPTSFARSRVQRRPSVLSGLGASAAGGGVGGGGGGAGVPYMSYTSPAVSGASSRPLSSRPPFLAVPAEEPIDDGAGPSPGITDGSPPTSAPVPAADPSVSGCGMPGPMHNRAPRNRAPVGRRHSFYAGALTPTSPVAPLGPRPPGGAPRARRPSQLASTSGLPGGLDFMSLGLGMGPGEDGAGAVGGAGSGALGHLGREMAESLHGCLRVSSSAQARISKSVLGLDVGPQPPRASDGSHAHVQQASGSTMHLI